MASRGTRRAANRNASATTTTSSSGPITGRNSGIRSIGESTHSPASPTTTFARRGTAGWARSRRAVVTHAGRKRASSFAVPSGRRRASRISRPQVARRTAAARPSPVSHPRMPVIVPNATEGPPGGRPLGTGGAEDRWRPDGVPPRDVLERPPAGSRRRPRPEAHPERARGEKDGVLSVPAGGPRVRPRAARRAVAAVDVDQARVDLAVAVGGLADAGAGPGRVQELRDAVGGAGAVLSVRVPAALLAPEVLQAGELAAVAAELRHRVALEGAGPGGGGRPRRGGLLGRRPLPLLGLLARGLGLLGGLLARGLGVFGGLLARGLGLLGGLLARGLGLLGLLLGLGGGPLVGLARAAAGGEVLERRDVLGGGVRRAGAGVRRLGGQAQLLGDADRVRRLA